MAGLNQDPTAPLADKHTLSAALDAAGVRYTIDFFEGALHGFAPPGTARYHRYASERHWERVHSLLRRELH